MVTSEFINGKVSKAHSIVNADEFGGTTQS